MLIRTWCLFTILCYSYFPSCSFLHHHRLVNNIEFKPLKATVTESTNSFETVRHFLSQSILSTRICLLDGELKNEMEKSNFWSAGNFVINGCQCIGVDNKSIQFRVTCTKNDKPCIRDVTIPFPVIIDSDDLLKSVLITMAKIFNCVSETKAIVELPFGRTYELPRDFKFNDVPHSQWLRSYVYDSIKSAVIKAIYDKDFPNKSKMQVKFNFPEGKINILNDMYDFSNTDLIYYEQQCMYVY